MLNQVNKIYCSKCNKYLFSETDTQTGYKRTDDNKDYHYDEIKDEFICDDCSNKNKGDYK